MLFKHWARRAASRAACTAGNRSAIKTEMIAITTSSSISVKPAASRHVVAGLAVDDEQQFGSWSGSCLARFEIDHDFLGMRDRRWRIERIVSLNANAPSIRGGRHALDRDRDPGRRCVGAGGRCARRARSLRPRSWALSDHVSPA